MKMKYSNKRGKAQQCSCLSSFLTSSSWAFSPPPLHLWSDLLHLRSPGRPGRPQDLKRQHSHESTPSNVGLVTMNLNLLFQMPPKITLEPQELIVISPIVALFFFFFLLCGGASAVASGGSCSPTSDGLRLPRPPISTP